MKTKLSDFSISTIRNLFFFSIITTPLLFNVSTKRIFEPDKISVLRSMGTIVLLFLVICFFEKWKSFFKHFSRTNTIVLILGILFMVSELLSCLLSITPMYSIWGSYHRLQGFYTSIIYFVLFLVAYYFLNTELWIKTFVNILVGTSIPVTLWAIFQAIGIDPIPWAVQDISIRVTSSLGNPIFLSAYLIMVIPVTLSKILILVDCNKERNISYYLNLSLNIILVLSQIAIVFLTKSRGPTIGFIAGILFFLMFYGKISGRKIIRYISIIVMISAVIASLFVVNSLMKGSGTGTLTGTSDNDSSERILNIAAFETGTGKVRVLIWKGVINLLKSSSPLRLLTGYGQESMYVSYNKFYSPELSTYEQIAAVPDRSHNAPFDTISTKGFIGLLAYLGLIIAIFSFAFRKMEIFGSASKNRLLWLAGLFLPFMLASSVFVLTIYEEFSGIAIGIGILLTLSFFLITGKNRTKEESRNKLNYPYELYAIGLLSGIAAHIAETQTGIPIVTTKLYFWIYAGAIVSILCADSNISDTAQVKDERKASSLKEMSYWFAFIINIFIITGGFDIISSDIGLKRAPGLYLGFVAAIWFFTTSLFILSFFSEESENSGEKLKNNKILQFAFTLYLFSAGIFTLITIGYFFILKPDTSLNHFAITERIANYEEVFTALLIIFSILMSAITMKLRKLSLPFAKNYFFFPIYISLLILCLIFIVKVNINPIKADTYFAMSSVMKNSKNQDVMIPYLEKAVDFNFGEENYRKSFALLYMGKGLSEKNNYKKWFKNAVEQAMVACRTNSENSHNFYILGLIYKRWTFVEANSEKKKSLYNKMFEAFDTAINLSPGRGYIYREAGEGYALSGDLEKAKQYFRKAAKLTPRDVLSWVMLGDSLRKLKQFDRAIDAYQKAIETKPKFIRAYSSIAYIYAVTGENEKAIKENLRVLEIAPNDFDAHKNLAILYNITDNPEKAIEEAEKALKIAPEKSKRKMRDFIDGLKR